MFFFTEIIVQPVQLGGIVFVFFLHKTTDLNHYFYFTVFMCAVEEKERARWKPNKSLRSWAENGKPQNR